MRNGFSLVELSIVLVILGLLVGGILAGQSLIHAAEIRSIGTDLTKYRTGVSAFRDKYQALPGDMANATSFWGAADGGDGLGVDCYNLSTPASGTATCNGNGNSLISDNQNGNNAAVERFRMWHHMANAGLVEGTYTGVFDPRNIQGGTDALCCRRQVVGSNVPASRIDGAGFMISSNNTLPQWGSLVNRFYFGKPGNYNPNDGILELLAAAITTTDAWNIDTKMDDGTPFNGAMAVHTNNAWGQGACSTSSTQNAAYDLAQTGNQCSLTYKLGL